VGQRRRLGLALLVADAPQLMLLDEPTNHISLTLAEELAEALAVAPGAVVAATHDRWLRRSWAGPQLAITGEHRAVVG
jgi:macrolide transport system ATP-binding/permease protein